ncbi:MAG TPA: alpha-glucan family phosphorylase [Candidatus Saccharimonadales bacterium]|nr:alpha-glucan family phosphorylase [Candidatus Saccharimonadales bacterium]
MDSVLKDPVCGMIVSPGASLSLLWNGQAVYFCSEYCRDQFQQNPKRFFADLIALAASEHTENRRVAYFSMEVALDSEIPTYSGGLGVLAGDMLRSCADLGVPVVGISMLWRKGYFEQVLDEQGRQQERPAQFQPEQQLRLLPAQVQVEIEGRPVLIHAWQFDVVGITDSRVPVILLDTNVEGNSEYDRTLTDCLYGGDKDYRLAQEVVLGIGGVRMLRALGYSGVQRFHMNEGHAGLLVLELMDWQGGSKPAELDYDGARQRCIFTTHTPVPAGHDQFDYASVERIVGSAVPFDVLRMLGGRERLNMTLLGLNLSHYVNGVAQRHEEVSREMFPGYPIHHITNGVHSATWICDSFRRLYDECIPSWTNDPAMLRKALSISNEQVWGAHTEAKLHLMEYVRRQTGRILVPDALTIGFARRATAYKRADLVFTDIPKLLDIAKLAGPLQFVFAGKAHPMDEGGKRLIEHIVEISQQVGAALPIVYLENYDLEIAKLIVSGVDLWLNTPQRPLEASGTSGMKAAHNGVPSFSTLDGWWIEGNIEGITGWSIGGAVEATSTGDSEDLLGKLEGLILPTYYRRRDRWIDIMRHTIALNASYFNTHRMVQQYVTNAYMG